MKHLNANLDSLTNAEIPAAQDAASVIDSVGVVTTASGGDVVGDLVINPSAPPAGSIGDGDSGATIAVTPGTASTPVGGIICDTNGGVFDDIAENNIAGGRTFEYTFFRSNIQEFVDGIDLTTEPPSWISIGSSPVASPDAIITAVFTQAGITAPSVTTDYSVGGTNNMTAFNIIYDQDVTAAQFAVTVSSMNVRVQSGNYNIRFGGTNAQNTFANTSSFYASDFVINPTGTYRGGNGSSFADATASFTIGCTNPGVVEANVCTGGTDFSDVISSSTNGSGGYGFYGADQLAINDGVAFTGLSYVELNSFPNSQLVNPITYSALQTAILTAGGFTDLTGQNNNDATTFVTRNAPADFTSFVVRWSQRGPTTAEFTATVSSIKRQGTEVIIGGTGALSTTGPGASDNGANAGPVRLFQASDFTVAPTGTIEVSVSSNVDPFPITDRQSGDWNVSCTPGTVISPTTANTIAITGDTTTTGDGSITGDFSVGGSTMLDLTAPANTTQPVGADDMGVVVLMPTISQSDAGDGTMNQNPNPVITIGDDTQNADLVVTGPASFEEAVCVGGTSIINTYNTTFATPLDSSGTAITDNTTVIETFVLDPADINGLNILNGAVVGITGAATSGFYEYTATGNRWIRQTGDLVVPTNNTPITYSFDGACVMGTDLSTPGAMMANTVNANLSVCSAANGFGIGPGTVLTTYDDNGTNRIDTFRTDTGLGFILNLQNNNANGVDLAIGSRVFIASLSGDTLGGTYELYANSTPSNLFTTQFSFRRVAGRGVDSSVTQTFWTFSGGCIYADNVVIDGSVTADGGFSTTPTVASDGSLGGDVTALSLFSGPSSSMPTTPDPDTLYFIR